MTRHDLIQPIDFNARWGALRSYAASLPAQMKGETWGESKDYCHKIFAPECAEIERYLFYLEDEVPSQELQDYIAHVHEQYALAEEYLFREVVKREIRFTHFDLYVQEGGRLSMETLRPKSLYKLFKDVENPEQPFSFGVYAQWGSHFLSLPDPIDTICPCYMRSFTQFERWYVKRFLKGTDLVEFKYTDFILALRASPLILR